MRVFAEFMKNLPLDLHRNPISGRKVRPMRALLVLLLSVSGAHPEEVPLLGQAISIALENDLVINTDRHYTHGSKLTYVGAEAKPDPDPKGIRQRLARWLPEMGMKPVAFRTGLALGQNIYTPTDVAVSGLQPNDRPYAGYLYGSVFLQQRGRFYDVDILDDWRFDLGLIGPPALGEEAQSSIHRWRNLDLAFGWGHQLSTEPTMAFKFQRQWKTNLLPDDDWRLEWIPTAGISLGAPLTYLAIGSQFRFGLHPPLGFGHTAIDSLGHYSGGDSASAFGAHLFTGVEVRAVGWNSTLDGTLFRSSHHVHRKPLVGDAMMGFAITHGRMEISYAQIFRSKEFASQKEIDSFGSLRVTVKW